MIICERSKCTACGACYNICPQNAIEMMECEHGFKFPVIKDNKCIRCNKCINICPLNFSETVLVKEPMAYYAAWNKDQENRFNSSSGGIYSVLFKYGLKNGYKIVGVRWGKDWEPEFCISEKMEICEKFRGSKYVQCNTNRIYKDVKKLLENGEKVMFFGTPCQCAALREFTKELSENLFVIDFVCHGFPSHKLFKEHLLEVLGERYESICQIKMRYKSPSWSYGSVRIENKDSLLYMKKTIEDNYFNLFNFNYSIRQSCHKCIFARKERIGDMSLCDFWGYNPSSIHMIGYRDGISGIMINTKMGGVVFNEIKDYICYESSSLESLGKGNQCLSSPFETPGNIDEFWNDYENGMKLKELNDKYIAKPYEMPSLYRIRLFRWILCDILKILFVNIKRIIEIARIR